MQLRTLPNGFFEFYVTSDLLHRGLRPSDKAARNAAYLIECIGMVGIDGTLSSIPKLDISDVLNDILVDKDDFPFPQLIITDKLIIICNRTSILELIKGTLTKMITVTNGGKWIYSASGDYIYLSNGVVTVERSPTSQTYALSSVLPVASAGCNFNGQTIIGNHRM